ncbi:MAG TPA: type I secretion C-terminal target domain-containing protein [Acetobacteraceae bacterium]|nr:type I secretion C-terminal target domain-containing protein [Acetobacteraceae bacterium]
MTTTTAISADDFLGTLGVNTHIGDAGAYSNTAMIEQDLEYLGVGIVRDSTASAGEIAVWQQVSQATGAKFDLYMPEGAPAWEQDALALVPQLAADGILHSIEGGNEEDDSYAQSNGNSLSWTAQFQQQVYAMGQQQGLPVINMSFGSGWTAANNWEGDYPDVGDLSAYTDYANAHAYPNVGQTPDETIQSLNSDAQLAAASRQVITTEIGWQTSQFSEGQIAQYVVDSTFDGIANGDAGMWFYGLYDDSSGDWGLFNSDGSARPAATALHNLTTLLADPGNGAGSFTPGSLSYNLSGTQSGDNSILMEQSNGSFWIGLWDEAGSQHTVTVNLPSSASEVDVFDPVTGTSSIASASDTSSVSVSLGGDPLLIEVMPNAGATTGTAPAGTAGSGNGATTGGSATSTNTSDPAASGSTAASGGAGTTATAGGAAGTPTDLAVTVPASTTVTAGDTTALSGISVSDSWGAGNGGALALNAWDSSGTLTIDGQAFGPGGGPVANGMFSGSLAQINADLASMTYTAPAGGGADTITVDVWNQAGVEVEATIAVNAGSAGSSAGGANPSGAGSATGTDPAPSGATSGSATAAQAGTGITIAPDDAAPVEIVNHTAITASSGDHMLFVGGIGNTVTLSGGTDTVQAFQGNNTITASGGNDTIQIAGSGNVVSASGGNVTIDDSGANNTIALPGAGDGTDDIFGYVLQNGDTLDLRRALTSTSWDGSQGTLGNYLSVSTQDNNAVISLSPDGAGNGSVIATLQGAGQVSLATLLQHAIT